MVEQLVECLIPKVGPKGLYLKAFGSVHESVRGSGGQLHTAWMHYSSIGPVPDKASPMRSPTPCKASPMRSPPL